MENQNSKGLKLMFCRITFRIPSIVDAETMAKLMLKVGGERPELWASLPLKVSIQLYLLASNLRGQFTPRVSVYNK